MSNTSEKHWFHGVLLYSSQLGGIAIGGHKKAGKTELGIRLIQNYGFSLIADDIGFIMYHDDGIILLGYENRIATKFFKYIERKVGKIKYTFTAPLRVGVYLKRNPGKLQIKQVDRDEGVNLWIKMLYGSRPTERFLKRLLTIPLFLIECDYEVNISTIARELVNFLSTQSNLYNAPTATTS